MKKIKDLLVGILIFVIVVGIGGFGIYYLMGNQPSSIPTEPENTVSQSEPFFTGDGVSLSYQKHSYIDSEMCKIIMETLEYPEYQYVWIENEASYANDIFCDYKAYHLNLSDFKKHMDEIPDVTKKASGSISKTYTMDIGQINETTKAKLSDIFNRTYKRYPSDFLELEDTSVCEYAFEFWDRNDPIFALSDYAKDIGFQVFTMHGDDFFIKGEYRTKCTEPKFVKMIAGKLDEGKISNNVYCIYELDLTTVEGAQNGVTAEWFPTPGETNRITIVTCGEYFTCMGDKDINLLSANIVSYEPIEN